MPNRTQGCRDKNANMRTQLQRIIAKSGLEVWPRLFANLRASRATELAAQHPGHVAAAWLGHSTIVANKHYWQVTEVDFERATRPETASDNARNKATEAKAAQNAAPSLHAEGRIASNGETTRRRKR